jgi:hypothetical protein
MSRYLVTGNITKSLGWAFEFPDSPWSVPS